MLIAFACPVLASASAVAVEPGRVSASVDVTVPAAILTQECGFPVTAHLEGTVTTTDFVDRSGTFSKEIDQNHLVQSFSANGRVLVGRTSQPIVTTARPDGSFSVAFMGSESMFTVPGAGAVLGNVGRLVLVFDADGDVQVVQETGQQLGDLAAVCAALAGPTSSAG
ncbi:hypothetical protein GCM10028772_05450 [Nocardioides ultimimeridianus]